MDCYTVTELAKIYNVSRKTVYNKLKEESIQEYVIEDNGKKLKKDGLNLLNIIMAESKRVSNREKDFEVNAEVNNEHTDGLQDYVCALKSLIEELQKDKESLQKDKENLQRDKENLQNDKENLYLQIKEQSEIMKNQLLLLKPAKTEPKIEQKKVWWKFWS